MYQVTRDLLEEILRVQIIISTTIRIQEGQGVD